MKARIACCVFVVSALVAGCGVGKHRTFGKIESVTGTVQLFQTSKGSWSAAQNGSPICSGDSLETAKGSKAAVVFGGSSIMLSENTRITISDTADAQNKRLVAVLNTGGEILSDVKDVELSGAHFEVWTPTAVAHAEGTHFVVAFSPQPYVTNVRVLDGRVRVFNPFLPSAPPVFVTPGCYTTIAYNEAPVAAVPMNYGQFKKMQRLMEPRRYHEYEVTFKVNPDEMALDAPIIVVPVIIPPTVYLPPPPMPRGPHGRLVFAAPFLLPPGPGLLPVPPGPGEILAPPVPRGRIVAPMPPMMHGPHAGVVAPVPPLPPAPHMGMIAPPRPVAPGLPVPPLPGVSHGRIGPAPAPAPHVRTTVTVGDRSQPKRHKH